MPSEWLRFTHHCQNQLSGDQVRMALALQSSQHTTYEAVADLSYSATLAVNPLPHACNHPATHLPISLQHRAPVPLHMPFFLPGNEDLIG